MKSTIIETQLGKLEYSLVGQGRSILFLHGGHSNCRETLSHIGFDPEQFQLITPSRPGYGNTPLGKNRTPKQAAALIVELLKQLEIDKYIVYGISAGGPTAIELAANYPDCVDKLILASAVSMRWLEQKDPIYKTAHIIFSPRLEKFIWGMVHWAGTISPRLIANSFFSQFSKMSRKRLAKSDILALLETMKYYRSKTGFLNDIDQHISEDSLLKIKCPALVIHSENDNSVSVDHAKHANRLIKNSKLKILQNEWGHLFWIGNDSQIAVDTIMEFIQSNES